MSILLPKKKKKSLYSVSLMVFLHIVEGHSIYIRNLPLDATVAHVTEEFTKFGPINHGGVQVRIHKVHFRIFWYIKHIKV